MAQRIMQYQSALQLSAQAPQLYDLPVLHRQMLEVLGIRDPEKIVPVDDDQKPEDPVIENMDLLNMDPVKAFEYQDHDSHIQVHMSMAEDPKMQEMLAQSPTAQASQAALAAHVTEHLAFKYRQQIEQELGIELPPIGMELPPEVESRLSSLIAEAAGQLLGKNQQQAQEEKNQEMMDDPVLQMQREELEIERQKVESKFAADEAKAKSDEEKLMLEAEKAKMRDELERLKISSAERIRKISADQEAKGAEIGRKIADDLLKPL